MGAKDGGSPLLGPGMETNGPVACPRHGGPLQRGAAPGHTPGGERSRKPWALPRACLQTLPPSCPGRSSALFSVSLPRRRKQAQREAACPVMQQGGGEAQSQEGAGGRSVDPLCRPSRPPEHLRLRRHGSVFLPGAWSIGRDVAQFSKDRSGFRAWPSAC